ncbi:MAG: hypothetical protein RLZZ11_2019 [Cyanobacteriota bacterium]|jgi:DNA-directed RNA polymerase specialized sigma24 family protein
MPTNTSSPPRVKNSVAAVQDAFSRGVKNSVVSYNDGQVDLLLESYRLDTFNKALREEVLLVIWNKAIQGAAQTVRKQNAGMSRYEQADRFVDLIHDAAYETLRLAITGLEAGREIDGGFVYATAANKAKSALNAERNQKRILQGTSFEAHAEPLDIEGIDRRELLLSKLALLPELIRQTLTLYFLDGLTLSKVAERLGIGADKAFNLKQKGIALLQVEMGC